jgi:hypothetical protein
VRESRRCSDAEVNVSEEETRPEEYSKRRGEVDGRAIGITAYRIGDRCVVLIDNVDPGATIARAEAESFELAEEQAIAAAREQLVTKRRRRDTLRALRESVARLDRAVRTKR